MNRPRPYADASVNRYPASQQPQMSGQRMQQNAQINDFHGRQQWDTNPQIELNPMSPHSYSQGHKGNMIHSQERMGNQNAYYENQANNEKRHEQEMEIGYEENPLSQLTFEGLEQRFQDEIMKLIKELNNAEDEENARHKERIAEMNTRYQENLSSLRVRHASRVGEFLRKESQTRLHEYQQGANAMRPHPRERGPPEHGGGPRVGPETGRPYGTIQHDESYREHERSQSYEPRIQYPHGRGVYNNNSGGRYY